ncbi:hypothetical protein NQ317_019837 [Molorchus minor]|nr:hypothetical protein NQ317_019837 [Molorchus minor]
MPIWVKFPVMEADKASVKVGFYNKYGIRGVIGAIDGTHVEIIAPPVADNDHPPFVYINRKGRHSINVMLISDSDMKIRAVDARYPGSVHDAAVWQLSNIRAHLMAQYNIGIRNTYLIGDSGYPLEPWLLTPFANTRNEGEERFNNLHKTSRNVIERVNGVLKNTFRCLSRHRILNYHPAKATHIIYASIVIYNMGLNAGLNMDVHEDDEEIDENLPVNVPVEINRNLLVQGREERQNFILANF